MQNDGKFIAAGNGNGLNTLLARYNPEGNLDASFGNNGVVLTNDTSGINYCAGVVIQSDGKIITAGQIYVNPLNHIAAARYNADGSIDKSFGTNGIVNYSLGTNTNVYVTSVAIQPDDKLLVSGLVYTNANDYGEKAFIERFTTDGKPDASFGNNGEVITTFNEASDVSSLTITNDNKILVGGTYFYLASPKFMIIKYLFNGTIDSSFGINGFALQGFSNAGPQLNSLALQNDGSILAGGYELMLGPIQNMALVRFTQNGILDSSFGENGLVVTQFQGESEIDKLIVQNDNKIVGAGTLDSAFTNPKFVIVRYLPNGDIDESFGINGSTITASATFLYCNDALLQNNEKIVLAGNTYADNNTFAFARYLNDNKFKKEAIIAKIRRWIQNHNGIMWDANSSINNYIVQRSYDGVHFNSIARIHPSNASNYTYQDQAPLNGTNYYRLQTTSKRGAVNYSNVIAVSNYDIKISPNPATSNLQIQGLPSNQKIKLIVVDVAGNIAISQQLIANSSSYNLNIGSLKQGNYLLKIEMNDDVVTKQFVKQ
jgi:uncharacterized delta-60 repeat protein